MSKNFGYLTLVLILVVMTAVGFLAVQVTSLSEEMVAINNRRANTTVETGEVSEILTSFQTQIKTQNKELQELRDANNNLRDQVAVLSNQNFMSAPEYIAQEQIFTVNNNNNQITATGDSQKLNSFVRRNELFLDHVALKTMPLGYDRNTHKVYVERLVPRSIFSQMGFEEGDRILTINGVVNNRGAEIREQLLTPESKTIVLQRGNKKVTLDLRYKNTNQQAANKVSLPITGQQFRQELPETISSLGLEPTAAEPDQNGLRIVALNQNNLFSKMNLQEKDILTKINGETVRSNDLLVKLSTLAGPINIEFIRNNQAQNVTVVFADQK